MERTVLEAIKMRGIRFNGKNFFQLIEYRLIPMITCSVKVGEELSASALARGLGSPIKRTNLCELRLGLTDYMIFILAMVTLVAYVMSVLA